MAWRGVTGLSPLPAAPGSSLTSCLNLCFPARPFALAQVPAMGLAASQLWFSQSPAADPVCCLRVTSLLVPTSCQPTMTCCLQMEKFPVLLWLWGCAAACKAVILYFCTRK